MQLCKVLLLATGFIGLSVAMMSAQEQPAKKDTRPTPVLKVSAAQYLLDQPVKIYVGLKNTTGKVAPIGFVLNEANQLNKIQLRWEDSDWVTYETGGPSMRYYPGASEELPPDETISVEWDLWRTASERPLLERPGKWSIRAVFVYPTEEDLKGDSLPVDQPLPTIESPIVEFTITEPTGNDAEAHQALADANYFPQPGIPPIGVHPPGVKELIELYEKYKDTAYGGEIAASLAKKWPWPDGKKTFEDIMERFSKEWANHQQAPTVLLMRAAMLARPEPGDVEKRGEKEERAQRRIRDNKKAGDILKTVEDKYPWCTSLGTFRGIKARLEGKERKNEKGPAPKD